jgi:hypothetical protein
MTSANPPGKEENDHTMEEALSGEVQKSAGMKVVMARWLYRATGVSEPE